jgi:serine/threonine protein kinase/Tol biopolymer transport system component
MRICTDTSGAVNQHDRWRRVEEICQAALDRDTTERPTFLATACGSDTALRREVEGLLARSATAEQFLSIPVERLLGDIDDGASLVGQRLGQYQIVERLGAGGMSVVYRAEDATLKRSVALKFLSPDLTQDEVAKRRFLREAQILAALNHPNIGAIYGVGELGGRMALLLEFVDGKTLAQRIAKRPLPLEEALTIAKQIAEALEAAHGKGIVHRDLKPSNVALTRDGVVKVLDFGVARMLDTADASQPITASGLIVGTPSYMSPEQLKGKPADKRSDLWAYGCVLYEMLTGKRPGDEPDWGALPPRTPASIQRLLKRCLEKDRGHRLADAADARLEIDDARASAPAEAPPASRVRSWRRVVIVGGAVSVLIAAAVATWFSAGRAQPMPMYSMIEAPPDFVLGEDDFRTSLPTRPPMVFAPDGRSLIIQAARAGRPQLFIRPLDRPDARPIPGTEDAHGPFVSPDGKWIGFWAANELRKVPIEGGTPTVICSMRSPLGPYGVAWSADNMILFGDFQTGRLMRVSANGGTPVAVTPLPSVGWRHVSPVLLPDGKRVLFAEIGDATATKGRLMVQTLDGSDPRLVLASASDGRLLPSGDLVFMRIGTLMTVHFDLSRAEVRGNPIVVLGGVMQRGLTPRMGANSAAGMFAVSSQGTLAVIRGGLIGNDVGRSLTWLTRDGHASTADPASGRPSGTEMASRISPDGSRAIVVVITPMRREAWIADWTRDMWTACADCDSDGVPIWSPDGRRVVVHRDGALVEHTLDGSALDRMLVREPGYSLVPAEWLSDNRIVYQSAREIPRVEIKVLEPGATAGRVVIPLGVGTDPAVSSDRNWLAYTTNTRPPTVVVQAFPGPGPRIQVSAGSGVNPRWSPDGKTLYYLKNDPGGAMLYAADVATGTGLSVGRARLLFQRPGPEDCWPFRCYDLSPDGQRFLFRERIDVQPTSVTRIDLIQNWMATLPKSR